MFEKRIQMCIELNILTTLFFYAEIENGELIDKDFYTERFSVYESVKKTVKKNLSEAITKKKNLKLTESALTKILTNIKRKGY